MSEEFNHPNRNQHGAGNLPFLRYMVLSQSHTTTQWQFYRFVNCLENDIWVMCSLVEEATRQLVKPHPNSNWRRFHTTFRQCSHRAKTHLYGMWSPLDHNQVVTRRGDFPECLRLPPIIIEYLSVCVCEGGWLLFPKFPAMPTHALLLRSYQPVACLYETKGQPVQQSRRDSDN